MTMFDTKAPQEAILDLPQERITGDILRGRGPRRGNLERLIKYWRPIMRKPGGFRRCLVILADHPELYPLERICAWLHHETTGLWPNEGNHHEGGKLGPIVGQARRFLKKPKRKKRGKKKKKSDSVYVSPSAYSFRTMVGESRNFGGVLVQPLAGRQNVLEMKAAMFAARHEELQEHRDEIKFKKVGIVGSGSAAGQAVQAVGSFLLPGDISDFRSPIRSQIYETLTPGGGRGLPSARRLVRRGSSGARNKYRCPPGFQKGGTFTNKTYSTCGAQVLALPNTGPGSLNADAQRALADLARDASIVRSVGELRSNSNPYAIIRAAQIPFAPKKGSPTRRQISTDLILGRIFDGETFGPRFVRRDGVILEPMVSEEFLRGLDEFDDMVDGSLVTTYDEGILGLDSLRTFGTGLRDNYIAIPDVGVAKISRVGGELSPETREGTIRAFNTSVESRSPDVTAPLMSFIDSSDGKFDIEFGDVVNNRYVKASEEQNELVEVIAGNVRKFVPKWVYNTFLSRSAPRRAKNDPIYEMVADSETKQKSAASFITPNEIDQTRAHSYHIGIDSKAAMFNAALSQADVELKIRLGRAGRAGRGAARAVGDIAGGASAVFDSTLKRYRCPPGTRRGGSFSDKFGSNCGYSLPKNLVNNFISVSQGLKKAMKSRAGVRRAANPEASKKARQGADTQRKNIERVADTLKTTLDKTEDKTSGGIGRTIAQTRKLRTLTPEERVALDGEPLRDALRNLQDFITAEKDNLSVRDTNNLFQALERISALEAGRITDNPTGDKQIQRDIQNSLQAIVGTMGEIVGTRTRTPERRRRREEARISPDVANVPNLDRLLVDPAEGTRARVRKGKAIPELGRFEFENEDREIDQAKLDRAVLAIEVTQADLANNLSDMIGRRRRGARGRFASGREGDEASLDDLAARTRQFLQENPNNALVARRYADLEELRELIQLRKDDGDEAFLLGLEDTVRRIAPSRRADIVQGIIGTDTPEARERVTSFTERAARQAQDRSPVTKLRNILDARRARREEARRMQVDRKTKFADVFAPRNKQAESTQAAVLSTLDIEGGVADFANPTWEEIAAIHRAEDQAAMDFFVGNMVSPEELKLAPTPEASHDMLYQMAQKARAGDTTEFRDWARKALSHDIDHPVGAPVEAIDPNTGQKVLVQKTIATNVRTVKRDGSNIKAGGRLKFKLKNALTGEVLYEDNGGSGWQAGGLGITFMIRRDKNMTNVEHGLLGTKHSVNWGGTKFDFNNGGFINQISTQGLPYYRGAGIDKISVLGAAADGQAAWPKKGFRENNSNTIRGLVREMKENVDLYRSLQAKRNAGNSDFTPAEVQAAVLFNDNPEIADRIGNMVDFADRQTDINKVPAHFEFMSALTRRDSKGAKIKDPVVFQYFGAASIPESDQAEILKRAQEIDPTLTAADMRNMRRLGSKYNGGFLDISHLKIRDTQREAADRFDAIESAKEGLRNVYGERVSNTVIGDTNINFIDEVNESGDLVTVSPHLLDLTENERIGLKQGLNKSLAALEAEDSEAFSEQNPAVARLISLSEEFTSPQDGLVNVGSANNVKLITQDLEDLIEDADEIGDMETRDNLTTLLNSIRGAQANENRVFSSEGNPVPVLSELDNFHERVGGRSRERTGRATRSVEGRYNMEGVDGELWEDEDLNDEVLNARLGNLLNDANISEEDWDGMSIQEAAAEFDMSQEEVVDRTIAASHMALVDEIGDDEIDIYGDPVDSGFQVNMTLEDIDLLQSDIDGYLREGRRSRPTDDELRLEKLSAELDNAAADKRSVYVSDLVLQSLKNMEFTVDGRQDDRDDFDPVPFTSNFDLSQLEGGKEYIRSTRNFDRDGEMLDINDDASPRYGADAVNAIRDAGPPPQRAVAQVRSDGTVEVVPEPVDADPINRDVPNILSSYPANDDFDTFNNRSADFLTNRDATIFSDNELDQVISDLILPDNAVNRRSLSPFDADVRQARSNQAADRPSRAARAFDLSPDARERRDSLDRWSLFEDGSRVEDPKFSTDNNQRVFGKLETEVSDLEILNNPDGDGYIVAGQYLDFDGNSEDLDFSGFYEFESIEEAQDWATGLDILLREAIDGDGDLEDYEDRLDRVLGNELYMGSDSFDPNFGYDSNSGLTGRLDRGREGRAALRDLDLDADSPERFFRDGEYRPSAEEFDRRSQRQQIRNNMEFVENAMRGLENVQESGSFGEDTDPDIVQWLNSTFELFDDDGSLRPDADRIIQEGLERLEEANNGLEQEYLDSGGRRVVRAPQSAIDRINALEGRDREGRMSFDPDDMIDNQIDDLLLERAIRKEASEDEENAIADMIEQQVDAMIEDRVFGREGRASGYNENVWAEDREFSDQTNLDRIYDEAFEANEFEPEALDPESVEFYMNNQDRLSEDIDDLVRLLRGEYAVGESEYATNLGYNDAPWDAGNRAYGYDDSSIETLAPETSFGYDLTDLIKIQAMVDRDKGRDRDAGLGQRRPGDAGFVAGREGRAAILPPDYPYSLMMMDLQDNLFALQNSPSYIKNRAKEAVARLRNMNRDRRDRRSVGREGRASSLPEIGSDTDLWRRHIDEVGFYFDEISLQDRSDREVEQLLADIEIFQDLDVNFDLDGSEIDGPIGNARLGAYGDRLPSRTGDDHPLRFTYDQLLEDINGGDYLDQNDESRFYFAGIPVDEWRADLRAEVDRRGIGREGREGRASQSLDRTLTPEELADRIRTAARLQTQRGVPAAVQRDRRYGIDYERERTRERIERQGRASQSLDDILQRTRRDEEREASRRGNEEFFRLLDTALNEKLRRRRMQDGDREGRASIEMPTRESVEAALTTEEKELLESTGPGSARNFLNRITNDGAWGDRAYSLIGPDFENSEYLKNYLEERKAFLAERAGGLERAEAIISQERAQAKAMWEIGRARDAAKQTRNHRAKFDRTDSALMRDVLNVTGVGKQAQDIMGQASAASGPPDSADEMIANLARNVRRRDLRSFGSPRESFLGSRKDIDELIDRLESKKGGLSDDDKSKVDQAIGILAAVRDSNSGMWRRSPEGNTRFGQVYAGSDPSVWKRLVAANDGLFDEDGGLDFSKMSDRDLEQILIDAGALEDVDWVWPMALQDHRQYIGGSREDWLGERSPRSQGLFGARVDAGRDQWYMDTVAGDEGGLSEFAKLYENNANMYSRFDIDGFDPPSYDSWVDEIDKELRRRGILQPDESWNDIASGRDFWGNDNDGSSLFKPGSGLTTAEYEEMKFMQGSRRAREGRASLPGDAARDYNVMVDGEERSAVELARDGDVLDNDYEAVTSMLDRVNEGKLISQRDLDRLSQSRFDGLADELERRDISVNRETRRVGDNSGNQDRVTDALQEVFGDVDDERLEFSNVLENAANVQKDPMENLDAAFAESRVDLDNWIDENPNASLQEAADYFRSRLGNNFNRYTGGEYEGPTGRGLTASQVRENSDLRDDLINRFFEDYMYDSPFEDLYRRILMPEKGQSVDDSDLDFRIDRDDPDSNVLQAFSQEIGDLEMDLTAFHEDEINAIENRFDSILTGRIAKERLNEATDLVRTGRMSREGRMARRDVDSLNIDGPPSRRNPLDGPLTGEVDPPFDVRRALDMRERRERGELSRFVDIPTPPPPPRGRDGRYINMMDPDDREMNMALSEVQAPRNTLRERLTSRLPNAQRRARSREAARRRREEETLTRMGLVEPERRSRYTGLEDGPPPRAVEPLGVDNDPITPPPPSNDFIEGRDRRLASYETNAQKRNQRLFEMGLSMEDDNEVVKSVDSARRRRTFSEAFTESSRLKKNKVRKRDWLEDTEWYSDEGPLLPDPVTFSSWVEEENVRDAREGVISTLQHIGLKGTRDYRVGDEKTPLIDTSFKSKVKRDFDYGSYPGERTLERMSDSELENYLVSLEWTLSQMEQDDLRKLPTTPFSDNPITRSKLVQVVENTREYLGLRMRGQTDRRGFNPRFRRERRQSGKEPFQEFVGSRMASVWEDDRRIRGGGRRERDARDLTSRERAEGWSKPASMGGEPDRESPEYRSRADRNMPGEGATSARGGRGFAPVRRQPDREGRASRMREGRAAVPSDDLVRRAERRERPLERNYSRVGSPRYQQEEIAELEEVLAGRKRLEELDDRYSRGFKNFVSYWQDNREADMAEEARFDREDFDYEAFRDSDVLPVQGLLERYLDTLYEDLQSDISSMRRSRNQRGINERTPVTVENRETGERRQGFYGSNIDQERAINEIIENRIGPKRDNESRTDYQERKLTALDELIASESGGGSETVMLGDGPSINYFDSYMDFTDEENELFRNRIEPFGEGESIAYNQPDTPSMEGAAIRLRNAIEGQVRFREGRFSRNVERDRGREDLRAPRRRDDLPPDEAAAPRIPREIRDPETGEMVRNPEFNELYEDRLRERRRRAETRQALRARREERRRRGEASLAADTPEARDRRARLFNESMDASDRRMADAERRRRESLGLEGQALQEERIENEQRDLEVLNEIREEAQLRDRSREGRASLRERISDDMFERVDPFDDYERYENYLREMYARYSEGQSFERIAEAAKTTPEEIESDIKWDIFGLYSDLYKSEHGIRPRWLKWQEMSIEDLENLLDTEYPSVPDDMIDIPDGYDQTYFS